LEVDGLFGRGTRAALMDYQLRHGLAVDGICGRMTINSMLSDNGTAQAPVASGSNSNTYPAPNRIVRTGHSNRTEVLWLQTELRQAGYQLAVDGRFGPGTRAALMDYQLRHGLTVDGVCGPRTIQSMISQ
ncbi:MAG: peptidoglycan-binding protein, partial [Lachnospiraceae bacterium]|nr:peptidoglycan-binding protein [Lachnospiraceae bacterium]